MALAIPFVSILSAVPLATSLGYLYAQSKQGTSGATQMAESGVRAELNQALRAEYAAFADADRAKIAQVLDDEMTKWKDEHPRDETSMGVRAVQATGALLAAPITLPIAGVSLLYNATKAELKRRSDAAADAKVKADAAKAAAKVAFEAAAPARAEAAVAQAKAAEAEAEAAAAKSESERAASAEATAKLKLATAKLEEYTALSAAATAESNRMAAESEAAHADVQRTAAAAAAAAAAEEVAAQKAREAADAETARAKQAEETQAAEESKAAAAAAAEAEARAAADKAAAEAEAKAVPFAEKPPIIPEPNRRPSLSGFESAPLLPLPPDLPPPTFVAPGPPPGPPPFTGPLPPPLAMPPLTFGPPPGGSTNVTPIAAAPLSAVPNPSPFVGIEPVPQTLFPPTSAFDEKAAGVAPRQLDVKARLGLDDGVQDKASKIEKVNKEIYRLKTLLRTTPTPQTKIRANNDITTLQSLLTTPEYRFGGKRRRTPKGGKRRRVRNSTFRRHRKH
jgi:hypothetical protein